MRYLSLSSRNAKEIIRDPLSAVLGIALPILMLLLFTTLDKNSAIEVFKIESLTPGIIVFGFSFLMMFSAILLAKDKKSAFLTRLFASPLTATDYIIGYSLPFLPIAFLQAMACFIAALILGLAINVHILMSFVVLLPAAVFIIGLGMLLGSLLNENQVAAFGSVLIVVTSLFSGAWMDLNMVGGIFKTIGYILPFAHTVDAVRAVLTGDYAAIFPHLYWIIGYMVVTFSMAVFAFKHVMKK